MASEVYPPATREAGDRRRELAPEIHRAFGAFSPSCATTRAPSPPP
ncbi:MAG TPA: hypothetical protein VFW50_10895 [Streptosporangiaceae bacterium]|nr:hypothetical protein [Streptosporangiaceae bacterium]